MNLTETVIDALQFYVYRLIDPRNGETFYIGKGRGNRIYNHVKEALSASCESSIKQERILDIYNEGLEPIYIVHRHGLSEEIAYEVEGALIDAYTGLTNDQGGHNNSERGVMSLHQVITTYDLPEMPKPTTDVILINVNQLENRRDRNSVYNQVRGHWRISLKNARQIQRVIAVYKGVAVGVFEVQNWYSSPLVDGRYCFDGVASDEPTWNHFIGEQGKRIVDSALKNGQNPIKYFRL